MKLVTKIAAVLAALALATPALACGDKMDKTVEAKATPQQTVAKTDKQKKSAPAAKHAADTKPAPAASAAN